VQRGEVWWAYLDGDAKRRPVLLLHRDAAYKSLTRVIVAEVTTNLSRQGDSFVLLTEAEGMPKRSVVNLDTLQLVKKSVLEERITALTREKMVVVLQAMFHVLGVEI
jgi:mRNA-degrading endonuclease toxin of MazEF toxin-antitoxin module